MTIETKYNIGDKVWFMFDGKPLSGKIANIGTFISIHANFKGGRYTFRRKATDFDLFPTKEELLKSML